MSTPTIPIPNARETGLLCASGLAGLAAYEAFSHGVAPQFVGHALQPQALVIALCERTAGIDPGVPMALAFHYATAVFAYPLAYWLLTRGILGRNARPDGLRWGLLWGALNAVLIMGVGASLAGLPFMLGFGTLAWGSLTGHMLYGVTSVVVFEQASKRRASQ